MFLAIPDCHTPADSLINSVAILISSNPYKFPYTKTGKQRLHKSECKSFYNLRRNQFGNPPCSLPCNHQHSFDCNYMYNHQHMFYCNSTYSHLYMLPYILSSSPQNSLCYKHLYKTYHNRWHNFRHTMLCIFPYILQCS